MIRTAILVVSTASAALAHSWLACSDYAISNKNVPQVSETTTWNPALCRGYPRNAATSAPKTAFGVDTGYNFQPGNTGNFCGGPNGLSASSYNADYPRATWTAGTKACMAWPAKNHVGLGNPFIKDAFTRIYRAPAPGAAAPTTTNGWVLVADMGPSNFSSQYPGVANGGFPRTGFQNCPNFANNGDKALCVNCIDVPRNLASGTYAMAWVWAFNGPNDMYSNCFEVNIVGGSGTAPAPAPANPPAANPPAANPPAANPPAANPPAANPPAANPPAANPPAANPPAASGPNTCGYSVAWMGGTGFGGLIKCTFASAPQSWTVTVTWDAGTTASNAWNSVLTNSGQTSIFNNAPYNGGSQNVEIGFNGQYSVNTQPRSITVSLNGGTAQAARVTSQDFDGELPTNPTGEWATNGKNIGGSSNGVSLAASSGLLALTALAAVPLMM